MFCPKCRAEYREGFTECADCKVPLVSELPPEPEPARLMVRKDQVRKAKDILKDLELNYMGFAIDKDSEENKGY